METSDFLTYISVLSKDAEKEKIKNMSKEDQILQGKCNDIASLDDINNLTR